MKWYWYWVIWFMAVAVSFLIPELYALLTGRPQNTLSWQVWRLEGKGFTFWRYVMGAFFLWLFLHITFGLFR